MTDGKSSIPKTDLGLIRYLFPTNGRYPMKNTVVAFALCLHDLLLEKYRTPDIDESYEEMRLGLEALDQVLIAPPNVFLTRLLALCDMFVLSVYLPGVVSKSLQISQLYQSTRLSCALFCMWVIISTSNTAPAFLHARPRLVICDFEITSKTFPCSLSTKILCSR